MQYELIAMAEFPKLAEHYDGGDEGHTRGHYEYLYELYELSLDDAETDKEKQEIEAEMQKFKKLIEDSGAENFALVTQ